MFQFADVVPESIRAFLIPYLAAWIDRNDLPLFSLETIRYGLITFARHERPADNLTIIAPFGEVDLAALEQLAADRAGG